MEETFVMIKPDGVKLHVFDYVESVFNANGLEISNVHSMYLDEALIRSHYAHLVDKPFYPHLQEFMLSGSVITMTVTGENAVAKVRELIGATNPTKADPSTIRGIYGNKVDTTQNIIHASDSVENAQIEIKRFNDYMGRALYFKK